MRILIALDESEQADGVLDALAPWLRRSAADVRLLSVMDASKVHETVSGDQPGFQLAPQGSFSGTRIDVTQQPLHSAETHGQALARAHNEREQHLRGLARRWLEGVSPRVDVVSSEHTAEAIADYATEIEADLIAVGTHGRSGLSRALMGSVAEELVRTSPVPVLTVRSGMHTPEDQRRPPEGTASATAERPSQEPAALATLASDAQNRLPVALVLVALGGLVGWLFGRRRSNGEGSPDA